MGDKQPTMRERLDAKRAQDAAILAERDRLIKRVAVLEEALGLLCDELELSMPDKTQEFDSSNIWHACWTARDLLGADAIKAKEAMDG